MSHIWVNGSMGKESACQCRRHRCVWVQALGQENPLEKEIATHSSILAWKPHGQRSLAGYSPWDHKESDTTKQLSTHIHTHTHTQMFKYIQNNFTTLL